MKFLLELALSATMFVSALTIVVAARRFGRFRAFWASIIAVALGIGGTSYTIFMLVFRAPVVEANTVAVEYLVFQVIKMVGLVGLVASILLFMRNGPRKR